MKETIDVLIEPRDTGLLKIAVIIIEDRHNRRAPHKPVLGLVKHICPRGRIRFHADIRDQIIIIRPFRRRRILLPSRQPLRLPEKR